MCQKAHTPMVQVVKMEANHQMHLWVELYASQMAITKATVEWCSGKGELSTKVRCDVYMKDLIKRQSYM